MSALSVGLDLSAGRAKFEVAGTVTPSTGVGR